MSYFRLFIESARALWTHTNTVRIPEPQLVMDDPAQVAAYHFAGREDGAMASVYLLNTVHISEVILPGETVLDLGCGPANQLGLVARLNPDVHFIGLDLAASMLERAASHLRGLGVDNVTLVQADITDLSAYPDRSVDAVISTLAMHHLPDESALKRSLAEIDRILKPYGGLYIADLGQLPSERLMHAFAHQYADHEPALYVQDYYHSLRAAFSLEAWRSAWQETLAERTRLYATALFPFMVAVKGARRRSLSPRTAMDLHQLWRKLPGPVRRDYRALRFMFHRGGMPTASLRARRV